MNDELMIIAKSVVEKDQKNRRALRTAAYSTITASPAAAVGGYIGARSKKRPRLYSTLGAGLAGAAGGAVMGGPLSALAGGIGGAAGGFIGSDDNKKRRRTMAAAGAGAGVVGAGLYINSKYPQIAEHYESKIKANLADRRSTKFQGKHGYYPREAPPSMIERMRRQSNELFKPKANYAVPNSAEWLSARSMPALGTGAKPKLMQAARFIIRRGR